MKVRVNSMTDLECELEISGIDAPIGNYSFIFDIFFLFPPKI